MLLLLELRALLLLRHLVLKDFAKEQGKLSDESSWAEWKHHTYLHEELAVVQAQVHGVAAGR